MVRRCEKRCELVQVVRTWECAVPTSTVWQWGSNHIFSVMIPWRHLSSRASGTDIRFGHDPNLLHPHSAAKWQISRLYSPVTTCMSAVPSLPNLLIVEIHDGLIMTVLILCCVSSQSKPLLFPGTSYCISLPGTSCWTSMKSGRHNVCKHMQFILWFYASPQDFEWFHSVVEANL